MGERSYRQCPQCQSTNEAGRKFCASCGDTLSIPCQQCAFGNNPDDQFCGGCGDRLTQSCISTLSPEENLTPTARTEHDTEKAHALLKQRLGPMDENEEEHYEIHITITPKKIQAEGHYQDIKYSAALESKDGQPLFEALNASFGMDNVKHFVAASKQFAFALFERSFDLDNLSIPHASTPQRIPAHTDGEHVQSLAMPPGGARMSSPVPDGGRPTAYYAPILFPTATTIRRFPCTRRFFLALVAIVLAVAAGGYRTMIVWNDAADGPRVTTEAPIPLASAVDYRARDTASLSYALPQSWPMHVPPAFTRAIIVLGRSRHYTDDKMVELAKALLSHRLSEKFLEDFRTKPHLLLDLFTDLDSFDTLMTIEDCLRGMTVVFNARWDITNWSKTVLEAKKLSLLEAIAAYRGELGAYMMKKEREFRQGADRDQTALTFPY